jgi:hypothetical protein
LRKWRVLFAYSLAKKGEDVNYIIGYAIARVIDGLQALVSLALRELNPNRKGRKDGWYN